MTTETSKKIEEILVHKGYLTARPIEQATIEDHRFNLFDTVRLLQSQKCDLAKMDYKFEAANLRFMMHQIITDILVLGNIIYLIFWR